MGLPLPPPPSPEQTWVRRRCVGRGSFGTVNLAVDLPTGDLFAVKSVKLEDGGPAVQFLESEIEILRSLSSPWIVSYLGDSTTAELPSGTFRNLLMEYVPGGTAAALPERQRDELAVRSYARCVASALKYLHSVGVVHGDVKGQNVLLGSRWGEAKLADFGSARRISGDVGAGDSEERWRGTPLWMAPEVVRDGAASPAADVWSLGCTVIEMVTGKAPWRVGESEDTGHVLLRIGLSDEVPEVPTNLSIIGRDFLDKCLKRNPAERLSCEELLRHPFLCETVAPPEPSPRSVFDWTSVNFDSEGEEGEDEGNGSGIKFTIDASDEESKAKLRDLASSGRDASWEDDEDWEVVRPVCLSLLPFSARDEEEDEDENEGLESEFAGAGDRSSGETSGTTGRPSSSVCCSDRRPRRAYNRGEKPFRAAISRPRPFHRLLLRGEDDAPSSRRHGSLFLILPQFGSEITPQRSPEFASLSSLESICAVRSPRLILALGPFAYSLNNTAQYRLNSTK